MKEYQKKFVDFLLESGALLFGDFTTKSGRKTPYFVNTGKFDDGYKIATLGGFYADHILACGLKPDIVFGPAYKGISLCVATTAAMFSKGKNTGFAFNRKEAKEHGDAGLLVGKKIKDGDRIVLVEDVITAGTTMREILPLLNSIAMIHIAGVVIAVDRCEKGEGEISAVQETEKNYGVKVYPIVTIHQILEYHGPRLPAADLQRAKDYLAQYGARVG